ncbi:MAG: hypothetical protein NC911_06450 [Candidatus Omnitrophica bacterium]|nr:hypothetical protein [Candidatus Omnitrophota bacterium]
MNNFNKVLLVSFFIVLAAMNPRGSSGERLRKIPFKDWPQVNFENIRVLVANQPVLAQQGFAGAAAEEMKNTLMIFPNLPEGVVFTNTDQGWGAVSKNLQIVYFDKSFRILKTDIMAAVTGYSKAPPGAVIAIEGLPRTNRTRVKRK